MNYNNIAIKYLFFFLPFALLSGPFLSDLLITIISIFFINNSLSSKSYEVYKNRIFYFFLCFYFILIFSVLFISPAPLMKQGTSIFFIRFGILMFALYYFLLDKKNIYQFYKIFFIIFILLICDSFFQFFTGKNILGFEHIQPFRISSFFGSELIMGSFISKIFCINLIFISFLNITENKKNYVYFLSILFSLILIFLSGERTSMGMFLFQIFFIIIFSKKFIIKKIIFYNFLFLIILYLMFTFAYSFKSVKLNRQAHKIYSSIDRFEHGIKDYISFKNAKLKIIESHSGHYRTAYKIFDDNKIFGAGIKSFRYLCMKDKYKIDSSSCSTHPHNTLLLFMSELGFIGLIIYFSFIIFMMIDVIKKFFVVNSQKKINPNYERFIYISGGILSSILPFLPNGNFFNNYMLIMFFLMFAIYLFYKKKLKIDEN